MKKQDRIVLFIAIFLSLIFYLIYLDFSPTEAVYYDNNVSLSLCYPCHFNLEEQRDDTLVFSHEVHFKLGINCRSCHFRFPHFQSEIERVKVEICYNCHRLQHGFQGLLAPKDCEKICHIDPLPYTEEEVNRTLEELKDFTPPTVTFDLRIMKEEYLSTELPVTMGKCVFCHDKLDANRPEGLIFAHDKHFAKGIRCMSCHKEYPHVKDELNRVPMIVCSSCHSLTHSLQGKVASADCALCHPPGFDLEPVDHTPDFKTKTHTGTAQVDLFACYTCHQEVFCENCHNGKVAKSPKKVYPQDHTDKQSWEKQHGTNTYTLKTCSPCHSQKYCDDCHQTRVPHRVTFAAEHTHIGRELKVYCDRCHKEQQFCSDCHHSPVSNELLTFESCEKCHPDVRKPLVEQEGKGIMVHRAHFEMTKTEPFECDECHGRSYATGQGCFTFELCKECHGKKRLGQLIAKWEVDNGEICMRCHPGSGGPAGEMRIR